MRNLTPEMEQLLAEAGRLRVGDAALRARGGSGAGAEQPAARQDPRRGHGCRPRHARGRGLDRGRGRARLQPVGRQRGGGRGALPHRDCALREQDNQRHLHGQPRHRSRRAKYTTPLSVNQPWRTGQRV